MWATEQLHQNSHNTSLFRQFFCHRQRFLAIVFAAHFDRWHSFFSFFFFRLFLCSFCYVNTNNQLFVFLTGTVSVILMDIYAEYKTKKKKKRLIIKMENLRREQINHCHISPAISSLINQVFFFLVFASFFYLCVIIKKILCNFNLSAKRNNNKNNNKKKILFFFFF